ncbi:hypothetical protein [Sphingomonas oryzagri]
MRADMDRIAAALCAGREPKAVAARIAVAFALAAALWVSASAFMLMEPLS